MKLFVTLAPYLLLVSLVFASPTVPTQWTTMITGYNIGGSTPCTSYSALWAFDYLNSRSSVHGNYTQPSTSQEFVNMTSLTLCKNATSLEWNSAMECTVSCCYGNPIQPSNEKRTNFFDLLQRSPSPVDYYEECDCAIIDIFYWVKVCRNAGSCISGSTIGTLWEFTLPDKTARLSYCFDGDIPLYYEFLNFAGCFTIKIEFSNFIAGPPSESYFQIPPFCNCLPN